MKRLLVPLLFFSTFSSLAGEGKSLFDELTIKPVPLSLAAKFSMIAAPLITYAGCYGLLKQGCHASTSISNTSSFFAAAVAGCMGYVAYESSDHARLIRIKNLLSSIDADHLKTIHLIAQNPSCPTRTEMDSYSSELLKEKLELTSPDTLMRAISVLENYDNKINQAQKLAHKRKLEASINLLKYTAPIKLSSYLSVLQDRIKTALKKSNEVLSKESETSMVKEESDTLERSNSSASFSDEVLLSENPRDLPLLLNYSWKALSLKSSRQELTPFNLLKSMAERPCLEKDGYTITSRTSRSSSSGYESSNSIPLTQKNLAQHNKINGNVFTSASGSEASDQGFEGAPSECESFHTCQDLETKQ